MDYEGERASMVERQLENRGIVDRSVLEAFLSVPRHEFVCPEDCGEAYVDSPLPIGYGQTISQPYIVALMTQALELPPNPKVLEIGTGSGYQSAILDALGARVYSIEVVEDLGRMAAERLQRLGYHAVTVRLGDGYQGWEEEAPFDGIVVAAAPLHVPRRLQEQLGVGRSLIIPVGDNDQVLLKITRVSDQEFEERTLAAVRFVPLVHPDP